MKKCKRCGKTKPHEEFPRPGFKKDGVTYKGDGRRCICKACVENARLARVAGWSEDRKKAYRAASRKRTRAWHKEKPHHDKARHANLAAKRKGVYGLLSPEDVQAVWEQWGGKCWICGHEAQQLDHFRPTNKRSGGTNTADNIRPACRECNHKRSHDWMGEDMAMKEAKMLKQVKELLHGIARTSPPDCSTGDPK